MTILTKATPSRAVKTPNLQKIIYVYALILVIFVLFQLFTFDVFLRLLESFWLPGGSPTAHILGSIIVISELFALPFLLRMNLSPLMRSVSMVLGWLVPFIWLLLTLWIGYTINAISNVGFLGTAVQIAPGWWTICASIVLAILAILSSWGLWPLAKRRK